MAKRTVITIGREFGSGGREIGRLLAEEMGLAFYDKELLEIAAKESGICKELFESNDEQPTSSLLYSLSMNPYSLGHIAGVQNLPLNQKLFLAQFETVQRLAKKSDCVIVGRCADYALRGDPDCVNVFIHAPLAYRVARIKELNEISSGAAKDLILKTDKKRAAYYNSYSDRKWGETANYHLALDSSVVGKTNAVRLVKLFTELRLADG